MTVDEVLAVAAAGAAQGCTEALFTLGEWKWVVCLGGGGGGVVAVTAAAAGAAQGCTDAP